MAIQNDEGRLARTAEALRVYDSEQPVRDARWDACKTNEDVYACQAADKVSEDKVREAFALDTADVNSRERAFLVHPDDPWLRGQVAKYGRGTDHG